MEQTIAEALMQRGEERGEERERLRSARQAVQDVLEERFDTLSEELRQRIATATDLEKLRKAHRQAVKIDDPDKIDL